MNAILDDASNEMFLNEDIAGVLGSQKPFKTDEVETFQFMPTSVMIESADEQSSKGIRVKTCPRKASNIGHISNSVNLQNQQKKE